ncbi:MAG: hypothetical protein AAB533_01110 [Patescibacteria group bacterium]
MSDASNGHDPMALVAPLPVYHPITEQTRCINCKRLFTSKDGTLPNGAEWRFGCGWCCGKCRRSSSHQQRNAERLGKSCLPLTPEERADAQAERFGFPRIFMNNGSSASS